MVQRFNSDRCPCKPNGVPSKTTNDSPNDDSNRTQRLSVADSTTNAVSVPPLQAMMDYCNIHACEMTYRTDSGKIFRVTRTQPEPQELCDEGLLTRRLSRSSVAEDEDLDNEDTASESGQARRADRRGRAPKRKRKRRGSTTPIPALPPKRRRNKKSQVAIKSDEEPESEDEMEGAETETEQLRVDELYRYYYEFAFRSINQLACKDILKAWIRICHPKKQSTHPYNGGQSGKDSLKEYGYLGHFTMPDYWPSDERWRVKDGPGARHREPDHVKRHERVIILVHLLRSQYKDFVDGDFSMEKLKQSTVGVQFGDEKHEKHWKPQFIDKLQEIYRIREKEMEFERREIDGDAMVPVRMPKSRRTKARKAPKSVNKVTSRPGKQVKKEPKETSSTEFNAPIANMSISEKMKDEDMDISGGSEPSIFADTCSSTEDVTPDADCPEPTPYRARSIQHRLPLFESPPPTNRRHGSVQENWTMQSANLPPDPSTIFTHPSPFGPVPTPAEAQRSLQMRDRSHYGSSAMQNLPNEAPRHQYGHSSTSSHQIANSIPPNRSFARTPLSQPLAPKFETIRHPNFAASSSGLVGAFPPDADYTSWQTDDLWNAHAMYTPLASESSLSLFPPSTNGSFSSGYSDVSFSSGLQVDAWNDGSQNLIQNLYLSQQGGGGGGLDEEMQHTLSLQAASGMPRYHHQPLGQNVGVGGVGNPELEFTNGFNNMDASSAGPGPGPEHGFGSFEQEQRQL